MTERLQRLLRLSIVCAGVGWFVGHLLELLEQEADRRARLIAAASAQPSVLFMVRDPEADELPPDDERGDDS